MKRIGTYLFAALAALLAAACEESGSCAGEALPSTMQVVFDWRLAPRANPRSMSLYLFSADDGEVLRYDFTEHGGGSILIPSGNYEALCLNSDTETISYRNTGRKESFEATTRTTSLLGELASSGVRSEDVPRAEGAEEERIAMAPDMLWSDHAERIRFTTAAPTLTLYPEAAVGTYTVEIRNAENLEYVSGIGCSLSGMAGGLLAGTSENTEERVTIPFEVAFSAGEKRVAGSLLAFGHCPAQRNRHRLAVYVVLSDGSKWYYTYDVTEQIHAAPDPRNVHIVVDRLPIPRSQDGGGDFRPSVDEWQYVDVDVEM